MAEGADATAVASALNRVRRLLRPVPSASPSHQAATSIRKFSSEYLLKNFERTEQRFITSLASILLFPRLLNADGVALYELSS